jgi:ribonuclease H2 subunit C
VPTGYRGVVLVGSEKVLEHKKESENDGYRNLEREESMALDEEEEEVKVMEEVGIFNGVWVWGHEMVMDDEDPYVRSLEEWVGVAESVSPSPSYSLQLHGRAVDVANTDRSTHSQNIPMV